MRLQHRDQAFDVIAMQTGGRFVEDIDGFARAPPLKFDKRV
jgi:hypothetical protein